MQPAVTVVIDSLPDRGKWKFYPERYPDALVTEWAGYTAPISDEATKALLTCDVIFSAETWYDPLVPRLARMQGVASVLYVNPELHRMEESNEATAVWAPTSWRIEQIPRAEHVSMPVALDRLEGNPVGDTFFHLGGHKARGDRNGMEVAIRAARLAGIPLHVSSQDDLRVAGHGVTLMPAKDDYWEMYAGHGVLVMPRKYGGLCLPTQEALAAGLAVIMTDVSPNQEWPVALTRTVRAAKTKMIGGMVDMIEPDRQSLADEMRRMLDIDYRGGWQAKGRVWAQAHSWGELKAEWLARLAELC
jgi:glycosyltransferase involved in cell wall biosynthesis